MTAPNIDNYKASPGYIRGLLERIDCSQRSAARALGIDETLFRRYLTKPDNASYRACPYLVQYALEEWAGKVELTCSNQILPKSQNFYKR